MWGEIEPCTGSAVSGGSSFEAQGPASPSAREAAVDDEKPKTTQEECPSALSDMIEAVAVSASPVKSQQLGEPDLTLEERRAALLEQYRSKPLVFLERYQAHLKPEHLGAFAHLSADCRTQYYGEEVRRRVSCQASKTSVKNHRYAALRALQQEGKYFSEEQMRVREPLLYEQYIGQYLNEDELAERSQGLLAEGAGGLADLLINSYQEQLLQRRLQWQQDKEEGAQEEDDEDDDETCEAGGSEWEPTPEEKARLREEFVSQMHERFLEGKDEDFNYSEVDENPDYDNLDIVSRDAEERYFDDEEEEEEEEDDKENEVAMD
ncbi:coiled-coil domain-containing protein 97 [Brienomyrus brachyistius]|uniref:coiled-coil domain-containing protein 97 n=1 Tax=Brienomyrus brachyistius TaxID=42636 RepID=UPI0020B3B196|nr:coiled-coil domain-containing protein 97 [Brienomyrus brachyistius]XP_048848105.1 coiled-coil domain-containing protein 97 [Brienomyrus brachyistius]XP_048848106.1 coiled-coil domain-containing protein 97 [Brienomyrus brachyistius]XP_048848108.1 coiled-coil domain-containing protein 97 [Brienomyrus brachyistius]